MNYTLAAFCSFLLVTCLLLPAGIACQPATRAPSSGEPVTSAASIELPPPRLEGAISLEETLAQRRSKRSFTRQGLSLEQVSQLLWAAQGITYKPYGFRTAPSAGALYPLELYLVSPDGVYHYLPEGHALERVLEGDVRAQLCEAALGQSAVREGAVCIVVTAVYERTQVKYGPLAQRFVHLEAGHAAQNILLQAVALGLGAVPIGAFYEGQVQQALSLPSDHCPLYVIPVGHPAE